MTADDILVDRVAVRLLAIAGETARRDRLDHLADWRRTATRPALVRRDVDPAFEAAWPGVRWAKIHPLGPREYRGTIHFDPPDDPTFPNLSRGRLGPLDMPGALLAGAVGRDLGDVVDHPLLKGLTVVGTGETPDGRGVLDVAPEFTPVGDVAGLIEPTRRELLHIILAARKDRP